MTMLPPTISGPIHLHVTPKSSLGADDAAALRAVVDHFLEAVRVHALPGTLGVIHKITQTAEGVLNACFDVLAAEPGSFRVLHGMLEGFSLLVAPLRGAVAWREPHATEGTVDLLAATAPLPSPVVRPEPPPHVENLLTAAEPLPVLGAPVPFDVTLSFRAGAAPPLAIDVVFADPLADDDKDRIDHEIRVWAALVQGGYPRPGDPPGASAMGPFTVRFDDPQTLRLSSDAFLAGDECFESLKALLLHWHATTPVVSLETE